MSELDRRTLLKGALLASAAAALPQPLRASERQPRGAVAWHRAPCRLCGVGCGLLVGVQGGRAVAVKGDPDSPVNRGLACVKGYYAPQMLYARDRITRAVTRRNGGTAALPLADAYDIIANRIRAATAERGADSVALYGSAQWTAEDALVAARFFRGALGSSRVDSSARLYTQSADAGLRTTFGLPGAPGTYDDIEHSDVIVLWNVNLAETDPVLFSRMLDRRRTSPAVRIIDVANLTTRTSYAADRRLLIAPAGELPVAHAICQEIIARGMVNRGFVERHVAFKRGREDDVADAGTAQLLAERPSDVDWNAYVRFLADYTPERVQRMAGLAADDIRWLASLYGDPTRKVLSVWGRSVHRQRHGTWINNALHNIHLLVGKVCAPGNGALPLDGEPGGAGLLGDVFGHYDWTHDGEQRRLTSRLWGVGEATLDSRAAQPALSIFRAVERGDVRVLWIQGSNPAVSLPNLARYREALRRSNCFVVVSEAYPTPTSDLADIVLPAALWIERDGVYVNSERRIVGFDQLVRPPGDARSDARHMVEVAQRLGYGAAFTWSATRTAGAAWDILRGAARPSEALPNADALRSSGGALWPAAKDRPARWRYGTLTDPSADSARGAFDFYGHPDHRAWIWLRPHATPLESPDRAFPFWFSIGSVVEHWGTGSLTRRIPTLHRAVPRAYVEINPDDARALGVRDGDRVRLTSRRGSLTLDARVNYRCQPPRGQLVATGFDEDAPVNVLTLDAVCLTSGQPASALCAVRVERAGGAA